MNALTKLSGIPAVVRARVRRCLSYTPSCSFTQHVHRTRFHHRHSLNCRFPSWSKRPQRLVQPACRRVGGIDNRKHLVGLNNSDSNIPQYVAVVLNEYHLRFYVGRRVASKPGSRWDFLGHLELFSRHGPLSICGTLNDLVQLRSEAARLL